MITLIGHLLRRMLTPGRTLGLLALGALPAVSLWLASSFSEDETYAIAVTTQGFTYVTAVLILTVATLRDERDGGTFPFLYMRPIGRGAFSAASLLGGIAAGALVGVGVWLVTIVGSVAGGKSLVGTGAGIVLYLAAAIGYASIFVPLGYLAPRSILFGLGYVVLFEQVAANAVPGIAQISVWRIATSIYVDLLPSVPRRVYLEVLDPVQPGAAAGLVKLGFVFLVGWGVLTWALRNRDAV